MTQNIYQILDDIGIIYEQYDHPAVYTVEEAEKYDQGNAAHSKNLFLRNKKGNKYFLVVLEASKQANLANLASVLGENKLSLASPDRLQAHLGLTPGAVSPFGLINDTDKAVQVVVDSDLLKASRQAFHPNVNTATLTLGTEDFRKFLEWTQNKVTYLDLAD